MLHAMLCVIAVKVKKREGMGQEAKLRNVQNE